MPPPLLPYIARAHMDIAGARRAMSSQTRLRSLHAHLVLPRHLPIPHRRAQYHSAAAGAALAADTADWLPIDAAFSDANSLGRVAGEANPLTQLSRGDVPAVILRRALPLAECEGILKRFAETGLLPSGFSPFVRFDVDQHLAAAKTNTVPPSDAVPSSKWVGVGGADDPSALSAERMDIGSALGNLGGDPTAFFRSAADWLELYKTLFVGLPTQPVDLMYGALAALSGGRKQVRTAYEQPGRGPSTADGAAGNAGKRTYCPCIYRSHMPGYVSRCSHSYNASHPR